MTAAPQVELPPWLAGGPLAQLFVHGQTHAERALVLARPQGVVCVPDEVEPAYLTYLAELGLGPRAGRCGVVMLGGSRDEVLRAYGELQTWCRQGR